MLVAAPAFYSGILIFVTVIAFLGDLDPNAMDGSCASLVWSWQPRPGAVLSVGV